MADETGLTNGNAPEESSRIFQVEKLYLKDLSFEAPLSPEIFSEGNVESDTQLSLKNSHTKIGENLYEVTLHLSVHSKAGDRSVFLIEIDQAGIFRIEGFGEEETRGLISVYCPSTLFPYAREAISSIVIRGGFPALVLQPINFDALYQQAVRQHEEDAQPEAE
jgi:preprotein translocase subunit SecB